MEQVLVDAQAGRRNDSTGTSTKCIMPSAEYSTYLLNVVATSVVTRTLG